MHVTDGSAYCSYKNWVFDKSKSRVSESAHPLFFSNLSQRDRSLTNIMTEKLRTPKTAPFRYIHHKDTKKKPTVEENHAKQKKFWKQNNPRSHVQQPSLQEAELKHSVFKFSTQVHTPGLFMKVWYLKELIMESDSMFVKYWQCFHGLFKTEWTNVLFLPPKTKVLQIIPSKRYFTLLIENILHFIMTKMRLQNGSDSESVIDFLSPKWRH